jgi:2-C-methyl-D-erythritol 4-phosphate cytidylyltransferase
MRPVESTSTQQATSTTRRFDRILALASILHEPADRHSASRVLNGTPVLEWTLNRLTQASRVTDIAVLCWDDQAEAVTEVAAKCGAEVISKGPRSHVPQLEALAAARRWADGWRGGLMQSCALDAGYHPAWVADAMKTVEADALLLVSPAAPFVDSSILSDLIALLEEGTQHEYAFAPAAPGLAGMVLTRSVVNDLARASTYPGRLFAYRPDTPRRDPLSYDNCLRLGARLIRTTQRATVDSDRQRRRIELSILDPHDVTSQGVIESLESIRQVDAMPRDVTLELNTDRATQPIFLPRVERSPITLEQCRELFAELGHVDDVRLTLGGLGDPLLHPQFGDIVYEARRAGIRAIHVETDLLPADANRAAELLTQGSVDVVSVFIPGMSQPTYAAVMGVDRIRDVLENMKPLLLRRNAMQRGTPIVVPTFVKCEANVQDMESWFDHWLRALQGNAAIVGPSGFAGAIDFPGVAEMCPSKRVACRRLSSRVTVLSDGTIVTCEVDARGEQSLGKVGSTSIHEAFTRSLQRYRDDHAAERWDGHAICRNCKEWDRP